LWSGTLTHRTRPTLLYSLVLPHARALLASDRHRPLLFTTIRYLAIWLAPVAIGYLAGWLGGWLATGTAR